MERELAQLLKASPGEPSRSVDTDALLKRRRYVGIALAAAAVVAVAVPVALIATRHSSHSPVATGPGPQSAQSTGTTSARDPKAAALQTVDTTVSNAAVPPGAQRFEHAIAGLTSPFGTPASPNLIDRTQWWTAPGTVDAALAYIRAHQPNGMVLGSYGTGSGLSGSSIDGVEFDTQSGLSVQYSVTSFRGGVAIRVDAMTVWIPNRPAWSFVPESVTSVDITIVRKAWNPGHGGAPTVRRNLTGRAALHLARALNALPPQAPEGIHSCPAELVDSSDVAVFHTPNGDIRMARIGGVCSFNAHITTVAHKHAAYVKGYDFDRIILKALGLPANYGAAR